jgi:hypothetical protein
MRERMPSGEYTGTCQKFAKTFGTFQVTTPLFP